MKENSKNNIKSLINFGYEIFDKLVLSAFSLRKAIIVVIATRKTIISTFVIGSRFRIKIWLPMGLIRKKVRIVIPVIRYFEITLTVLPLTRADKEKRMLGKRKRNCGFISADIPYASPATRIYLGLQHLTYL